MRRYANSYQANHRLMGVFHEPLSCRLFQDCVNSVINADLGRIDYQLRVLRHFIGGFHTGEALENSGPDLGLQVLLVTLLAHLNGRGHHVGFLASLE
jgi:hypothetical protein